MRFAAVYDFANFCLSFCPAESFPHHLRPLIAKVVAVASNSVSLTLYYVSGAIAGAHYFPSLKQFACVRLGIIPWEACVALMLMDKILYKLNRYLRKNSPPCDE
jgi:hypothetical protein